MILLRGAVLL